MKRRSLVSLFTIVSILAYSQTTFLDENFNGATDSIPPSGWTINQLYTLSALTDFWRFDDPTPRSPGGGFASEFAIFDSDAVSNDGTFENIALESPSFSTQGYDTVLVAFDVALYTGGTAQGNLEVFNGSTWTVVNTYPNTALTPTRDTFDISQYVSNNCDAAVRFRWTSNSLGAWAIDNVEVFSPMGTANTTNVRPLAFLPNDGSCGSLTAPIAVQLRNDGVDPVDNVPLKIEIYDGNVTQTYTYTDTVTIATCADTILYFDTTADLSLDSTFTITVTSNLTGDQQKANSDTLVINDFHIITPADQPTAKTKDFCGYQMDLKDTVQFSSGQNAAWYASSVSQSTLGFGEYYTLGNRSTSDSVFVETFKSLRKSYPAANLSPGVGYPNNASGMYMDIEAKSDVIIDSLELEFRTGGKMVYEIYTRSGSYVGSTGSSAGWTLAKKDSIANVGTAPVNVSTGGIKIDAGNTTGLYIFNSTNLTMEFTSGPVNGENSDIKYYSNDVNPTTAFLAGISNFGFGGIVSYSRPCFSDRVKYEYNISPKPTGGEIVTGLPFNGIPAFANGQFQPDRAELGETVTYELTPPTGFTNADFGTTWAISSFTMETEHGTTISSSDTTLTTPSSSGNGTLTFTPSSLEDSVIIVSVTLLDLANNCDSNIVRYIEISPQPKIDLNPIGDCEGTAVNFENNTTIRSGSMSYKWFFGNGDSSIQKSPQYTYTSTGSYTVSLTVTSLKGITSDTSFTLVIRESPDVGFSVINACIGKAVDFVNSTTVSGSGTVNYKWYFGDGDSSTAKDPSYNYSTDGSYDVELVADLGGCKSAKIKQAVQFPIPTADFFTGGGCHNKPITFTNTSTSPGGGSIGALWDFNEGKGLQTGNPLNYTFESPGTKSVKIIAISQFNCKDSITKDVTLKDAPIATFDFDQICDRTPTTFSNATNEPSGTVMSYTWTFGDGGNSTQKEPMHQYSAAGPVSVTLVALSSNGCNSLETKSLTVGREPIAMFEAATGCSGEELQFSNTTQRTIPSTTYKWFFGDGDSSDVVAPKHVYTSDRFVLISATLQAKSDDCISEVTKQVTIAPNPSCAFTFEQSTTDLREFTFTPDSTNYASYKWNFGGNGSSTQTIPTFTFANENRSYDIELDVITSEGCICSSDSISIYTGVGNVSELSIINSVNLYPNPSSGIVTISFETKDATNPVSLRVLDLQGKEIYNESDARFTEGKYEMNLSEVANGTYIVQLLNGKYLSAQKLTISH